MVIAVILYNYLEIILFYRRERKKSRSPRRSRSPRNKRKSPERKPDEVPFDPTNPDKVSFHNLLFSEKFTLANISFFKIFTLTKMSF